MRRSAVHCGAMRCAAAHCSGSGVNEPVSGKCAASNVDPSASYLASLSETRGLYVLLTPRLAGWLAASPSREVWPAGCVAILDAAPDYILYRHAGWRAIHCKNIRISIDIFGEFSIF